MRVAPAFALTALLITGACTTDGPTTPAAGPGRTAEPSPSHTRPADALRVLVRRATTVELSEVTAGLSLKRLAVVSAPTTGLSVDSVSASTTGDPLVCLSWSDHRAELPERGPLPAVLTCHEGDQLELAFTMPMRGHGSVAVRADGKAIAWTEWKKWPQYWTTTLALGDVEGAAVQGVQRYPGSDRCTAECFEGSSPDDLAFAGRSSLLMDMDCEGLDRCDMRRLSLDAPTLAKGWSDGSEQVRAPSPDQYYGGVGAADASSALVGRFPHSSGGDVLEGTAAVRIDLSSGRVTELVARADKDRWVASVSGGRKGIAYVTGGIRGTYDRVDLRFYVRLPGQARGSRLSGVPADAQAVLALGGPLA